MLICRKEVDIDVDATGTQRQVQRAVGNVENRKVVILPLHQRLIHRQRLRVFVDDDIAPIGIEDTLMRIQEEPCIDIALHYDFPAQVDPVNLPLHEIVCALKKTNHPCGQVLIHQTMDIRRVVVSLVTVRCEQDTIAHIRVIPALAIHVRFENILCIHRHIADGHWLFAMRALDKAEHAQRQPRPPVLRRIHGGERFNLLRQHAGYSLKMCDLLLTAAASLGVDDAQFLPKAGLLHVRDAEE